MVRQVQMCIPVLEPRGVVTFCSAFIVDLEISVTLLMDVPYVRKSDLDHLVLEMLCADNLVSATDHSANGESADDAILLSLAA